MLDVTLLPPVAVLEEVQKSGLDEEYARYKASRIRAKLKKLGNFYKITEENTFIILRKWNEYWSPFTSVEDLKILAEIQAEFSKYIILPRSPVPVYEVWRAVDFDPLHHIWVRDSWAPCCENCIHVNLRTGRCASQTAGHECPDFFKYTAVDVLADVAKKQEAFLKNFSLAAASFDRDSGGRSKRPGASMFAESLTLLEKEMYELSLFAAELLEKYVVKCDYVGEG